MLNFDFATLILVQSGWLWPLNDKSVHEKSRAQPSIGALASPPARAMPRFPDGSDFSAPVSSKKFRWVLSAGCVYHLDSTCETVKHQQEHIGSNYEYIEYMFNRNTWFVVALAIVMGLWSAMVMSTSDAGAGGGGRAG